MTMNSTIDTIKINPQDLSESTSLFKVCQLLYTLLRSIIAATGQAVRMKKDRAFEVRRMLQRDVYLKKVFMTAAHSCSL
jgi:hypothetical protein